MMTKNKLFEQSLENFVNLNMEFNSPSYTTGYLQSMMSAMFTKLPKKEQLEYLDFMQTAINATLKKGFSKTQKVTRDYVN